MKSATLDYRQAHSGGSVEGTVPKSPRSVPELYWRSLAYFNAYRIATSLLFAGLAWQLDKHILLGADNRPLFFAVCAAYGLLAAVSAATISLRRPSFHTQLTAQVIADVVAIAVVTYSSGGLRSGLGLMLLVSLAAAGLVGRGRLVLFYAALASLGIIIAEADKLLLASQDGADVFQAGLLSAGYFAIAWSAHTLSKYAKVSEQLATQRGIDLANLGHVNQLVINDMDDGVLVVDRAGAILQRNPQANSLLGSGPLFSEAMTLDQYCPEFAELLAAWKRARDDPVKLMRSPVTGAELRLRFVPIGGEKLQGTLIFAQNISQEQAHARQVKLAALGRLTANVAHEIRNPLSAISHAAELLYEEKQNDPTQAKLLRIIQDNSNRLDRIVKEVLQLNRRDRAQSDVIPAKEFLISYVDQFCQIEKAPAETFALEIDVEASLHFDRNHLHQVLWNLTSNAFRHCRKQQGSVRFCLNRASIPNTVQLDLIDDGPGVSPEMQNQLFEPFFTTENQGTGLGLYIARELCEANGASLEYVEVAPGGQFRILIREAL